MQYFTGFPTKLINMIIKIQFVIYINAQKVNSGFIRVSGCLDVKRKLRTGNQMTFISIGF